MLSCAISYHTKYLTVFSSEAVVFQIEWIASGLGPSAVELTLPLNAPEGPKLPFATVIGHQVVLKDRIQLPHTPLQVTLGGNEQLLSEILTDPRSQFSRQPAENRVGFAIGILQPCWPSLYHLHTRLGHPEGHPHGQA